MKLTQLASRRNLELAWRRITTGGNQQYKYLYRSLYYAYEVALNANLRDLRQRLLGGTFSPSHPKRIYVPKASGLHRPLALLNLEDQIVLQAFANLAAKRMQPRRAPLQFKAVFSNIILEKRDSIFFFRRWQDTYSTFQHRIRKLYRDELRWVGDFDLAAFYDTISHELLLKTIYPRTTNDAMDWIAMCLQKWSSDRPASGHGHGLPQGPLASDFLAECFLLPIDLVLQKHRGYMRYVDDVRLLGATENEVRADLLELEHHCRERGLIPQTGKFAIKRAQSVQDALGMLPSLSDPQHAAGIEKMGKEEAWRAFLPAIEGKPYRVIDKTRLRYVLYRAEPDTALLKRVLLLIPRHPEHADAFFAYLGRFEYRKPIEKLCLVLVEQNPYSYVRGKAWHVLARYLRESRSMSAQDPVALTTKAIAIAKQKEQENFVEKWGACHFLCISETLTKFRHSRFVKFQPPLLQSLLAPVLPEAAFTKGGLVETYLRRTASEPGLSVCSGLHERRLTPATFGLQPGDLPSQVANTLRELGVVATPMLKVDPIAEILKARYGLQRGKPWHQLLGKQYVHALGLLKQAEAVFDGGAHSGWLVKTRSIRRSSYVFRVTSMRRVMPRHARSPTRTGS